MVDLGNKLIAPVTDLLLNLFNKTKKKENTLKADAEFYKDKDKAFVDSYILPELKRLVFQRDHKITIDGELVDELWRFRKEKGLSRYYTIAAYKAGFIKFNKKGEANFNLESNNNWKSFKLLLGISIFFIGIMFLAFWTLPNNLDREILMFIGKLLISATALILLFLWLLFGRDMVDRSLILNYLKKNHTN